MFDVYIQFVEYVSFLRAMNGLRNMKLAKMMDNNVISETMIKVGMVDLVQCLIFPPNQIFYFNFYL